MEEIRNEQELLMAIAALEAERAEAAAAIRENVISLAGKLRSVGIIKDLFTPNEKPGSLINMVVEKGIQLTAGYINKRMQHNGQAEKPGIRRKLLSTAAKIITSYPVFTAALIRKILSKKSEDKKPDTV